MRFAHLASASLLLVSVACRNGPTGPDPTLVIVEGSTATYQDIDVSLQRFNLSWYPGDDSPFPSEGDVFATLLVEITNRSEAPRVIAGDQFVLRTLSNALALHEGPVWALYDGGRAPRVEGLTVPPGTSLAAWLTFEVPRGLIAEELLWSPAETLAFALEVRWWLSAVRTDESLLFGYVRDATGSPVPGMRLTITPLETVPGIQGAETIVGDCTGVLHDVLEAETDVAGRYEIVVGSIHSGELCIDVHPVGDPLHRASGLVAPGKPSEVAETPQLRLDLVVGE